MGNEAVETPGGEVGSRWERAPLTLHHANADRTVGGLFDQLDLADADPNRQLGPRTRDGFGNVGAARARTLHDLGGELEQGFDRRIAHRPWRVKVAGTRVNRFSRRISGFRAGEDG